MIRICIAPLGTVALHLWRIRLLANGLLNWGRTKLLNLRARVKGMRLGLGVTYLIRKALGAR